MYRIKLLEVRPLNVFQQQIEQPAYLAMFDVTDNPRVVMNFGENSAPRTKRRRATKL